MFSVFGEMMSVRVAEGITRTLRARGRHTLMVEFHLAAGCEIPLHSHPQEQTGILVDGQLDFRIGDECRTLEPGAAWCIPSGIPHKATAIKESRVIEVFSPPRTDYLASDS